MAKITLNEMQSLQDLTELNDNFTQIEDEFQNKVLYRLNPSGEPNQMEQDLDMNSNRILNLPKPTNNSEAARLLDVQNSLAGGDANLITYNDETVQTALDSRTIYVQSVAEAVALPANVGVVIETNDYYSGSTGGGNKYEVVAGTTGTADGGSFIDMANGNQLKGLFPGDVVSVKQYGALSNGTGDQHPIFKTLFESDSIKNIHIPSGTYLITPSTEIEMKSNKYITADPDALVLVAPNTGKWSKWLSVDFAQSVIENIIFDGFRFDANIENNTGGQALDGTDNQQYFMNFVTGSFLTRNIRVKNCFIKDAARNTVSINGTNAKDIYIHDNIFEHSVKQTDQFEDNTVVYVNAQNYFITNNHLYTPLGEEFSEAAIEGHWGNGVIEGNIIERFTAAMHVTSRSASVTDDYRYEIIASNNVINDCVTGITLWSFSPDIAELYVLENIKVTGNVINIKNIGIGFRFSSDFSDGARGEFRNITISDNDIHYALTDLGYVAPESAGFLTAAINVGSQSNVYNCQINNNTISNSPYGGISVPTFGYYKQVFIDNNKFINPCAGGDGVSTLLKKNCVFFDGNSDITLFGNSIYGVSGKGYSYASNAHTGKLDYSDNKVPHDLESFLGSSTPLRLVRNNRNKYYLYENYTSAIGSEVGFFKRGDTVLLTNTDLLVCTVNGQSGPGFDIAGSVTVDSGGNATYSGCEDFAILSYIEVDSQKTYVRDNNQGQDILSASVISSLAAGTYPITNVPPTFKTVTLS